MLPVLLPLETCNLTSAPRFVIKCLIPHVERQLRTLHEVVTNRKSRSLFSGAKRWFGGSQNKGGGGAAGAAGVSSVIYGKEAPELQG